MQLGPVVGAELGGLAVAAGRARLLLQVVGVPAAAAAGDVRAAAAALGGGSGSHGTHVGRWARALRATRGWLMMVAGGLQEGALRPSPWTSSSRRRASRPGSSPGRATCGRASR